MVSSTNHDWALTRAAGSVEAIFTLKSLHEQVIAPTINLENPGEGCDLDYVLTRLERWISPLQRAILWFGGTNGTLVFGKI